MAAVSPQRTSNLLGALACAVVEQIETGLKTHPNQNSTWFAALNLIGCFDGCSNNQLGQALGLSHPATVRLVDKLEVAGLVTSAPGQDRRAVALHLTSQGQTRTRQALAHRSRVLDTLVEHLPLDQQHALDSIADTLLTTVTTSPMAGAHLCRFCDETACEQARCPVHRRAVHLARLSTDQ